VVFLFFILSIVTALLFAIPYSLHRPLQQGLFLFCVSASVFSFCIRNPYFKNEKFSSFLASFSPISDSLRNTFVGKNSVRFVLFISLIFYIAGFGFHFYGISKEFSSEFLFQDSDYIGMDEVIREIFRGNGFHSAYYSESGKGSYLSHHFAPSLFFYIPFVSLFPDRWGYAIGCYTYTVLGIVGWGFLLLGESKKKGNPHKQTVFWILWIALLNQLYIYRLGTSYHFEVLVLPFSSLFFYFYISLKDEKERSLRKWFGLLFSLGLFLSVKEDIAVYVGIFSFVSWLYEIYLTKKNSLYKGIRFRSLPFVILILSVSYFIYSFLIFPYWIEGSSTPSWTNELSRDYAAYYKKVEGLNKSFRIFLEIAISGGLGIITVLPEAIVWMLIYITHIISSRPWHHEVYSYYSYTLLPFVLFSGVLWIGKKKEIPYWGMFLILGLIFYKNSLDGNYPMNLNKQNIKTEAEIQRREIKNKIGKELEEAKNMIRNDGIVYSQYNLSFYAPKDIPVRPIRLFETECLPKSDLDDSAGKLGSVSFCYVMMAPGFTDEAFHPKQEFLETEILLREKKAKSIYQGSFVELWKLSF